MIKFDVRIETEESFQNGIKDHLERINDGTEHKYFQSHIAHVEYFSLNIERKDFVQTIQDYMNQYGKRVVSINFTDRYD